MGRVHGDTAGTAELETFAHVAAVVALLILAYVHAKPAVNRSATIRYLRKSDEVELDDLLTADPPCGLPLRRRAASPGLGVVGAAGNPVEQPRTVRSTSSRNRLASPP